MKKFLALVLACLMALALVPAMAEDASVEYITEKGTFILGFDPSFPPMGYTDENGDYIGFDLDLAKEVCVRLGVELILQPIDWSAKELELSSKNIDCIWNGMTATPERAESMSLSDAYLENAQIVCVKADSEYQTLADLAGKVVALQAGSSAEEALEGAADFKASLANVNAFEDNAIAFLDLDKGNCDAVVVDVIVANYYIAKKGADYRVLGENLAPEQYAIGFRKEDVALRDKVNALLMDMVNDGKMAEISNEWFASDITIIGK